MVKKKKLTKKEILKQKTKLCTCHKDVGLCFNCRMCLTLIDLMKNKRKIKASMINVVQKGMKRVSE